MFSKPSIIPRDGSNLLNSSPHQYKLTASIESLSSELRTFGSIARPWRDETETKTPELLNTNAQEMIDSVEQGKFDIRAERIIKILNTHPRKRSQDEQTELIKLIQHIDFFVTKTINYSDMINLVSGLQILKVEKGQDVFQYAD